MDQASKVAQSAKLGEDFCVEPPPIGGAQGRLDCPTSQLMVERHGIGLDSEKTLTGTFGQVFLRRIDEVFDKRLLSLTRDHRDQIENLPRLQ
jgi:hypothetical protein